MRSRKKKQRSPLFALLLFAFFLGLGGTAAYRRYGPSSERMTEEALYGVRGERTAIMYEYELQKATAICRDQEAYLPIEWVQTILNKRFYWDAEEGLLLYALPDQVVRMTLESRGESGRALCVEERDKLWLSAELVETYTGIRVERFLDGDVKRIFISIPHGEDRVSGVRGNTVLRSRPSIKGSIVGEVSEEERLRSIPDHPNAVTDTKRWRRVMTKGGVTGYVRLRKLYAEETVPYRSTFEEPVYRSKRLEEPIVLGWHQVTTKEANQGIDSVTASAKGLTVIAPTWFSLRGNEGEYQSLANRSYVEAAHRKGLKVWALIDNFDDSVTLGAMLKRSSVRERLIENLMRDAENFGLDGINVDFELLRRDAVKQYLQFIRELSVACRRRELYLSVDVPNPAPYNAHYDREELGVFCDYVINMGYDEHTGGDPMGSTSSIGFFRAGITDTLKEVPAEKLIAGVPFYTRIWKKERNGKESSEIVTMRGAEKWMEQYRLHPEWNEESGQYVGSRVTDDGSVQWIWMEEERSMALKLEAIRAHALAGIACWKLGIEKNEIWELMSDEKSTE